MKSGFGQRCAAFFKQETVLCIAAVLAIVSVAFNPPSTAYAGYIDWETLAMLFSLMAVMKGFQKAGLFVWLGNCLLRRTDTTRKMLFVLVFLPFSAAWSSPTMYPSSPLCPLRWWCCIWPGRTGWWCRW